MSGSPSALATSAAVCIAALARCEPSYARTGRLISRKRIGATKTGFGDLRVTDSVVEPRSPVENCSLTPRWPITTRSAIRAWSQISFATIPMPRIVSHGTFRSAHRRAKVSSRTRPRSRRASRIFAEETGEGEADQRDHVQAEDGRAEPLGEPERMLEGGVGVLGAVESDQDALDHARRRPPRRVTCGFPLAKPVPSDKTDA